MSTPREILDFYTHPARTSSPGKHASYFQGLPRDDASLDDDALAFLDRLAACSRTPDESFDKLTVIYESDERVRVPDTVFNAVLNRLESTGHEESHG